MVVVKGKYDIFYAIFPEQKISDKTSQNKDLSQCDSDSALSQIRGPQKILCTFGEKEHTSKRVSVIACDNVISKVQCATRVRYQTLK